MHQKDLISKHMLKRMTLDMARVLLGLDIIELEILETERQRVEERRADLVAVVFRDYLLMLEILSGNRDLKQILKEEEKMLSQVKYSDLPSYELGKEAGLQEGRIEGEALLLQKLLQLKFGSLPDSITHRIQAAESNELLAWSARLLSADSLTEIFTAH